MCFFREKSRNIEGKKLETAVLRTRKDFINQKYEKY